MEDSQRLLGFNGDLFIEAMGLFGPGYLSTNPTPEWIVCPSAIVVEVLEEYVDGVSTDVLTEHGLTAGQLLPDNYILKSCRGAGFSKLRISGGNANGFQLAPQRYRNTQDSPESGIYKKP